MSMRYFDSIESGDVYEITLSSGRGMEAKILSLGAALRSLSLPDMSGRIRDIVLGFDKAEEYLMSPAYFGATVGRFCGRIAGSCFELNGKTCELVPNEGNNQLHGGPFGFSRQLWTPLPVSESEVRFRLISPDGDMGYPGTVNAEVCYRLSDDSLIIDYTAETDAATVISLTNHSYFNLRGHDSGSVGSLTLRLAADRYTPTDASLIPTGEICPVEGTALDLRQETALDEILKHPQLQRTNGLDHNFVLGKESVKARLADPESGLAMSVYTDRPAVQIYTAGALGLVTGKGGVVYKNHQGICLETQGFPDAMHHEAFPSPVLRPGERWQSRTVYRFTGLGRIRRRRAAMIWM